MLGLKLSTFGLLFIFVPCSVFATPGPATKITIEDVVQKVSTTNYKVYTNALGVYQSKQSIQSARGNLLPKLDVWKIANVVFDWTSVVGLIQDIAPFLVPNNWVRVEQTKLLHLANEEGYRAVWANELMTAKSLYIHLLFDESLLGHIREAERELQDVLVIVKSREAMGGVSQGVSSDIEVRLLALQEDARKLSLLIDQEKSSLGYMMTIEARTPIELTAVSIPDFDTFIPLDYEDFEFRTLDSAPETRQYDFFIMASDYLEKEVLYSFLGGSTISRGTAGGIFDRLPVSGGLGFSSGADMRIAQAEKEILKKQKLGIVETIKRQLDLLVTSYNSDLQSYVNLKRQVDLTKKRQEYLFDRLKLGQNVEAIELVEASRNHIEADIGLFDTKFRLLASEDRLSRLLFHGDYTKKPVVIEELKK
ncbi:MAG: TolC family protein [Bacteriovoracia bacterium]